MISLALNKTAPRDFLAVAASWLAVAFALFIPISNSLTLVISLLVVLASVLLMERDRAMWGDVLKHPIAIPMLLLIALSLIDISYTVANSKQVVLALRKVVRLLYFPLLLPLFLQLKTRQGVYFAYITAIYTSVIVAMYDGWTVFKDTIFTSYFVAFAIFMLAHLSIEYKEYRKLIIPLALLFTFYLFFICTGRTGQVLFFLLAALFLWQRVSLTFKQKALAVGALCAVVALCLSVPSSFLMRQKLAIAELRQYVEKSGREIPHSSSMGTRLVLLANTWELIKLRPILGWGTGSYPAAYAAHAPEAQLKQNVVRANPHNQYLLTWTELGLPGLFCLLWLFFSAAWLFFKEKQLDGYLGLGLVLSMMTGCLMNSWLLDCTSMFFFVYFTAVFAGGLKTV